ncbi:hypothetical protein Pse7367_1452 [Thalassoporum mexicanum PCC 7367]|uniref:cofactor assembly of complex C subunit B n=1 Tax=Thalassoporum mexicanum TaxID=3457544 RepID=UPI00029F9B45|nr:cofactor assembly of complex C subunit B [Pseudanabaena sp. PCC 7367]AFY69743.1 hypothetical protein Pse7367_1452 [Pseudanabaena sp. PCC 7367]
MSNTNSLFLDSALFLTSLLIVGLFFFIKGSTKDRTQSWLFEAEGLIDDQLLERVRYYLQQRAYKVIKIEPERELVTLEGHVKPSAFLAGLLVFLSALGLACLGLVLSILLPTIGNYFLFLCLMAPLAGVFYWRGADRDEQISLQLRSGDLNSSNVSETEQLSESASTPLSSRIWVSAHKDELVTMQKSLNLVRVD